MQKVVKSASEPALSVQWSRASGEPYGAFAGVGSSVPDHPPRRSVKARINTTALLMGSLCSKASATELAVKPSDEIEKELGPAELCSIMKTSLPIGTQHRTPLKKFSNCFSSVKAVNWMLEHNQARDTSEAVRKLQTLLARGLVAQVDGRAEFELDAKRFYRFTSADDEC